MNNLKIKFVIHVLVAWFLVSCIITTLLYYNNLRISVWFVCVCGAVVCGAVFGPLLPLAFPAYPKDKQ